MKVLLKLPDQSEETLYLYTKMYVTNYLFTIRIRAEIKIKIKMLWHRVAAEACGGGGGGGVGVISGGSRGVVGDGALYPHCILTVSSLYPHFIPAKRCV